MSVKVVLDTNIFVSSFYGGNPEKIIDLWLGGDITLCLSDKIIEEYVEILLRMRPTLGDELERLLALFSESFNLVFTKKTPSLSIVKADSDDDKFIECAVALKADFIITGDKALEAIGEYRGVKIVSPAKFLTMR